MLKIYFGNLFFCENYEKFNPRVQKIIYIICKTWTFYTEEALIWIRLCSYSLQLLTNNALLFIKNSFVYKTDLKKIFFNLC